MKLSSNVLDRQIESFLDNSLSVVKFLNVIRYAVMDFYFCNSLSIILADDDVVQQMICPMHLQMIRVLPSFRRYIEYTLPSQPNAVKRLMYGNDLMGVLSDFKDDLQLIGRLVQIIGDTIWLINSHSKRPSFQYKFQIYVDVLNPGFLERGSGAKIFKVIKFFSMEAMNELTEAILKMCDEAGCSEYADVLSNDMDVDTMEEDDVRKETALSLISFLTQLLTFAYLCKISLTSGARLKCTNETLWLIYIITHRQVNSKEYFQRNHGHRSLLQCVSLLTI